jgi:CRISPR-associated endonuclease/helicase Cas3
MRKHNVATLTGTMRGAERDGLVKDPVFARFLPRPDEDVKLQEGTVFLVATSAGEVGIDLSADHLVSDLPPFDALAQRLGRVNRYGEGDAEVHVFCEPLTAPPSAKADGDESGEDYEDPGEQKDKHERARFFTKELLGELPLRGDDRRDASPAALRALPRGDRLAASTPCPVIPHVDALLFDRWSYTTITAPLPGRPPIDEWLHGKAEWEPPRTTVAWRREVAWLTSEHLEGDSLDDFLADYPLRARETLSERTDRVLSHLKKLAARDGNDEQKGWLVRHDDGARFVKLGSLVAEYDSKRNPTLDGATLVLAPEAGGLDQGLLDGAAAFDPTVNYDIGPKPGERLVHESEDAAEPPEGMRLVRAVKRTTEDDDKMHWWHLYAVSQRADDEGSRTSRKELLLETHLRHTERWAARIAQRLDLPGPQRAALALAGRAHDLGKRRRVWQRSIQRFKEPPLAKGRMQPLKLGHYRHELGSLHDGDFSSLGDEDSKDLAMHAVAAHHGRARPHFPAIESFDPELKDEAVTALAREVPLRFDRLQRRYGRWGLAWLESILRAADVLGSEDEEVAE